MDIILFGEETTDASTGQVGPGVAGHLGTEQATYIHDLEWDPQAELLTATRSIGGGHEILKLPIPACVTCELKINTPRIANLNGKLRGAQAALITWSLADLTDIASADWVGLKGSPTVVGKVDVSAGFDRRVTKVVDAKALLSEFTQRGVVA